MSLVLHGYWRSSAAYRVRMALNLKELSYRQISCDLRHGAQHEAGHRAIHAQGLVPALETSDGTLIQSSAILEWLEERYPSKPLLPPEPGQRAIVRAMVAIIGSDIHPISNLRVLNVLRGDFSASDEQVARWIARWVTEGFRALEALVAAHGDGFAFGDAPTFADCFLVPHFYSAHRFAVDTAAFPALTAAVDRACELPAVAAAHPSNQPDADPL